MRTRAIAIFGIILFFTGMLQSQNVGVGTTSPTDFVHIKVPSGHSDPFRIQLNGATKMKLTSNGGVAIGLNASNVPNSGLFVNGNVGIGVQGGIQKLEVNGGIKIGNTTLTPSAGVIRYSGGQFYGYTGSIWESLNDKNDGDSNPSNELQTLSFNSNAGILTLSSGNSITLPTAGTNVVINDKLTYQFEQTPNGNARVEILPGEPGYRSNIFIGYNSGQATEVTYPGSPPYGQGNIFIGESAGANNSSGLWNTSIGDNAGQVGTIASFNTLIGAKAGRFLTSSSNTMIGTEAGGNTTTGTGNVFVGEQCGMNMTLGHANVYVGKNTGQNGGDSGNNVYVGSTVAKDNVGGFNTIVGAKSGSDLLTGIFNTYIGAGIEPTTSSESYRVRIANGVGDLAFHSLPNQWSIFNGDVRPDDTNTRDLGLSGRRWRTIYLLNTPNVLSDRRAKKGIHNLTYGLESIMQLRPVSYKLKSDPSEKLKLGLIAQEVIEVIPEIVHHEISDPSSTDQTSEQDQYSMSYTELIPVLIEAIQDQQKIIEQQSLRIDEQHEQFKKLEGMIMELKSEGNP